MMEGEGTNRSSSVPSAGQDQRQYDHLAQQRNQDLQTVENPDQPKNFKQPSLFNDGISDSHKEKRVPVPNSINMETDLDENSINSQVLERLENFVKFFVEEYQARLHHLCNKNENSASGKLDILAEKVGKVTSIVLKSEWPESKKHFMGIPEIIYKNENFRVDFKKDLIEGSFEIFRSFEAQFMRVSTVFGPKFAMKLLAKDAVNRSLSFYSNHTSGCPLSSSIIYGDSKIKSIFNVPIFPAKFKKSGYLLFDEVTNSKWMTSEIYTKVGFMIDGNEGKEYWQFKNKKNKFGFRLLTPFESGESIKNDLNKKGLEIEECREDLGIFKSNNYSLIFTDSELITKYLLSKNSNIDHRAFAKTGVSIKRIKKESFTENNVEGEKLLDVEQAQKRKKRCTSLEIKERLDHGRWICAHKNSKNENIKIEAPIELFTGRQIEILKLHNLLHEQLHEPSMWKIVAVVGIGGIGKTEMVKKYIQSFADCYEEIIWLDAGSRESLWESFNKLNQQKLGNNIEEDDILKLVQDIFYSYSLKNNLFVFDNVEEASILEEYLPKTILLHSCAPQILVTSRLHKWSNPIKVLYLTEMQENDALHFIKEGFKNTLCSPNDKDCKKLAEFLQFNPFYIHQAILYISKKNLKTKFSILEYLDNLKENPDLLLNINLFKGPRNNNKYEILISSKMKLVEILQCHEIGFISIEILNIASFMSTNNIYCEIFMHLFITGSFLSIDKLEAALNILSNFSLIDLKENKKMFTVDEVLQKIMRINMSVEETETLIRKAAKIILCSYSEREIAHDYDLLKRGLLFHLESLLKHVDKFMAKVTVKNFEEEILIKILMRLGLEYLNIKSYRRAKSLLERGLKITNELYGVYNMHSTGFMYNIGLCFGGLGQEKEAAIIFANTLPLFENYCGNGILMVYLYNYGITCNSFEEFQTLSKYFKGDQLKALFSEDFLEYPDSDLKSLKPTCLYSIGRSIFKFGFYQRAQKFFENTLSIFQKQLGENSLICVINLVELGVTYGKLAKFNEQKLCLKKAHNTCVNYFSDNSELTGWVLVRLSHAYICCGEPRKSLKLLDQASCILNLNHDKVPENCLHILYNVLNCKSDAYEALNLDEKQLETLEDILEIVRHKYRKKCEINGVWV